MLLPYPLPIPSLHFVPNRHTYTSAPFDPHPSQTKILPSLPMHLYPFLLLHIPDTHTANRTGAPTNHATQMPTKNKRTRHNSNEVKRYYM